MSVPQKTLSVSDVSTIDALAAGLTGDLIRPSDAEWDRARGAWQLLADQQPVAVVTAADRNDVALTVRAATALGLRVAPQSTGHNATPLGDLSRTILLRTGALNGIDVDADARIARVEAGVRCGDLTATAAAAGLTPIGGFSADVGVVGLVLGGGLGWFARSHATARASVLELELVTADGVIRHVRIGDELFDLVLTGADIAVITALTLRLHPIGDVVAGTLFWPVESTREILRAWTTWTATSPETVTSVARALRFPAAPDVPPIFAGRSFVVIEAVLQTDPATANTLLAPLRELSPQLDTFDVTAPSALAGLHMDPPVPVPARGYSAILSTVPADAIADAVTGPAATLTSVELRQLGGALDRDPSALTDSAALLFAVAVITDPASAESATAGFRALTTAIAPAHSNRDLTSFTESPTDPARLFGEDLSRLRSTKDRWDAADVIHANHPVQALRIPQSQQAAPETDCPGMAM
ncbi:putative FAD/FMN-containing dehydrogenase [Nocardia nova SH22a]|uniref:Putative FAD/FMN-containing dehydrogenase n=1 Tax=Nocardia nova SH22a TaxID=1415166 RepID=W5TDJ0_9NOCA|nr:FAD-binding protein [Nocardia nova]AHH17053.1 putative FAD/FMN-containing dehydrogenase [Nocardia nova SH22a]